MSKTIEFLQKFCDGTGLGHFQIDELKAANYIAQNPNDNSWFVTAVGHAALQEQAQHQFDWARAQPQPGDDMTQGPDDDSYWPPSKVLTGAATAQIELNQITRDALDKQEGGSHYKDHAIQPIEYIHANKLGFIEGNVVKYITRHASKGGAEDVRKVIHYCELLLQLQYGEKVS